MSAARQARLACLALLLVAVRSSGAQATVEPAPQPPQTRVLEMTQEARAAVERGLDFLASRQEPDFTGP